MGSLTSEVKNAVFRYIRGKLTDADLKEEISKIISNFLPKMNKKVLYRDLCSAVRRIERKFPQKSNEFSRLWDLLEEIDPQIKYAD